MHPRRLEREDRAVLVPCPSRSPARGPTWGACRKPRARLPADPGGTWLRCAALRPPGPRSVCPAGPSSPRPGRVSAPPRFPHTLIWSGPGQQALLQLWRHLAATRSFARHSHDLPPAHLGWRASRCAAGSGKGGYSKDHPPRLPTWGPKSWTEEPHTSRGLVLNASVIHISRFSHSPNSEKSCFQGGNSGDSRWWKGSYGNRKGGEVRQDLG